MTAAIQTRFRGFVVSHTHWDRAWYLPFQAFRYRLVRAVDRLLDLLDRDPNFRAFTLDGQTVLLDDYLEIRPENGDRLREHVSAGRLSVGPWYTMPDLFLVSGEAIVRNLQLGRKRAEAFGGCMSAGYSPDPFGHCAQMPQILRGVGINTYLFMRGLDEATKSTHGAVFDWAAPDGSTVTAIYLREGYFAAGALGHPSVYGRFDGREPDLDLAKEQIEAAIATMSPLQTESALLLSNGFDHMPPQPELPALIEQLNADLDRIQLEQATLPEFIAALQSENGDRLTYTGDLLGNADQPILRSVDSTRIYLKQQNHRAQQLLVQYAEPLSVWMQAYGFGEDVRAFLARAWTLLLQNHPHDDICGCSVDGVHDDAEARHRQIEQIADTILVEHLEALVTQGFAPPAATSPHSSDVWVFNPHPWQHTARVETRLLLPNPDGEGGEPRPERQLLACDGTGREIAVTILDTAAPVVRNNYLETTWGRRYDVAFDVTLPPLGYQLVHLYESDEAIALDLQPAEYVLETDRYRLAIVGDRVTLSERATGTYFPDLLRFEYQSDRGDTYTFGPDPERGPWWAALVAADWHPVDPDALRVTYAIAVPVAADSDEFVTLDLEVALRLEGESVAIAVSYDNRARDGRLRAVLPVGFATRHSLADGHFRLAPRTKPDLRAPETSRERYSTYPGELDYPTHHQGDFVLLDGDSYSVWIANRGLPEYELLDPDGDTYVALTLHRAVGYLSVGGGLIRPCQAGPSVPTPGAQCLRSLRAEFAFGVGRGDRTDRIRDAKTFAHPVWARELPALPYVTGSADLPRASSLLQVDNPHVVLSALAPTDTDGVCILRLYNLSDRLQETRLHLGFPASAWCETTALDTWDEASARPLENASLALDLQPHQIRAIAFRIL